MELLYSFVIIFCSLFIYFSTKKMYDISKYPGIKYFRVSFLFFAAAYFFKSFINFFLVLFGIHEILEVYSIIYGLITLFLFMYASTMAIFYLFYSVVWKKFNDSKFTVPLIHVFVIIISAVSIMTRELGLLLLLQVFIFLFVAVYNSISYSSLSEKKKKAGTIHVIYLFLFVFWMLNLADLLIQVFDPILELVISMVSVGLFLAISYKVTRNVAMN